MQRCQNSLYCIQHGKRRCWKSPIGMGTFVSLPWGKPQQLQWGYLGSCQQNCSYTSELPCIRKQRPGRRDRIWLKLLPQILPPSRPDLPSSLPMRSLSALTRTGSLWALASANCLPGTMTVHTAAICFMACLRQCMHSSCQRHRLVDWAA